MRIPTVADVAATFLAVSSAYVGYLYLHHPALAVQSAVLKYGITAAWIHTWAILLIIAAVVFAIVWVLRKTRGIKYASGAMFLLWVFGSTIYLLKGIGLAILLVAGPQAAIALVIFALAAQQGWRPTV